MTSEYENHLRYFENWSTKSENSRPKHLSIKPILSCFKRWMDECEVEVIVRFKLN